MARRAREIVIVITAIFDLAALGLHGNDRLAAQDRGEMELAAMDKWIVFRRAPGILQILLQRPGNAPGQRLLAQSLSQ